MIHLNHNRGRIEVLDKLPVGDAPMQQPARKDWSEWLPFKDSYYTFTPFWSWLLVTTFIIAVVSYGAIIVAWIISSVAT